MNLNQKIKTQIENKTGSRIISTSSLSGGCISNAFRINTGTGGEYFLKINDSSPHSMFANEANGLSEIKKANAIRVPEVILFNDEFILLEFIDSGNKSKSFFSDFGKNFAAMHKFNAEKYGFYEDNFIGSNPQKNIPDKSEENDWVNFYFNKRILYQFKLAERNGYADRELRDGIAGLEKRIEDILSSSTEPSSLLHGDLWGGNYIVDEKGNACLIDPAVYYGHREADLAMTKLFGGFTSEFYHAYNDCFPLKEGYEYREPVYKLYHVLNHLNLFGGGYYSQAISLIYYYLR
jgi:protein-ribulosamine 3-kinase